MVYEIIPGSFSSPHIWVYYNSLWNNPHITWVVFHPQQIPSTIRGRFFFHRSVQRCDLQPPPNLIQPVTLPSPAQTAHWLVVATHLKNISQIGNLPQIGVKIKNLWNHHLAHVFSKRFEVCHQNSDKLGYSDPLSQQYSGNKKVLKVYSLGSPTKKCKKSRWWLASWEDLDNPRS